MGIHSRKRNDSLSFQQLDWLDIILDYRFQEIDNCDEIADLDQMTGYAEQNWRQVLLGCRPDDLIVVVARPERMDSIMRRRRWES